jgi:orotidine-5'-phosphate decarboxylase
VIIDEVADANPAPSLGSVGLVVGATIGRTGIDFSQVNGSILAPGIGAQGAGPDDLVEVFGPAAPWCCPPSSREVMAAGPDPADLRTRPAKHPGGDEDRPRGGVSSQLSDC